ncbi:MAG: acetyl-CoA hydrolase/transferase C-terminal domain-containing protein, partial [Gammaproteobacteria bacterium]
MTEQLNDVGGCVDAVLRRVGPRVVLALPLGIGKPNPVANEFYRRAARDPSIDLTIITALSLRKPVARNDLERRLLAPLVERVFGNYPELEYVHALRRGDVPANIHIIEFFLEPGAFLDSAHAQQNYLSANYTHVMRDVMARGVNVIAHLVAKRVVGGRTELSFGSNADVTSDLLPLVDAAKLRGHDCVLIGQVHAQMPFMPGHAQIEPERFDWLIEDERYDYDLFCPPNLPIGTVDHSIALHVSSLVRDGGTLQVGIGELGDALVYALLLRHQQNAIYQESLSQLGTTSAGGLIDAEGGRDRFTAGLFASTEMFIDQLLDLYRAGVLRRRVYDSLPLERLLASGAIAERIDETILASLLTAGVGPQLTRGQFNELQTYGVFRRDVEYSKGRLRAADGEWIAADLSDAKARTRIAAECLGRELQNGQVLHAGFFLGPRGFYAALRDLSESERSQFGMRGVAYVNQLYGSDQELRILQRRDARFVNTTMMVTLLGAAVSDGLADGRVVSGVGGQYNFVSMAHALPGARSILCVRSTRTSGGKITSNIVWNYAHTTIPRHLRDVVVTEYGVADLRGRTDQEVIAALLNVADSRFQASLLAQAKAARKVPNEFRIPDVYGNNFPARLESALEPHRRGGFFSEYPFGTDLTADEIVLARALKSLQARTTSFTARMRTVTTALFAGRPPERQQALLKRLQLDSPTTLRERLLRRLKRVGATRRSRT